MRFLLAFALIFVSVFASAQVPMVLGGPQGIDVTRILVRNWMSIPIYADTPAAPLTGSGWPGRGYLITVVKNETPCQNCPPKDTSLWIYTGNRWKRVGMDYVTRLVYGGQVSKASGSNLNYIIQPYGAFFDGDYRSSSTNKTATLAPKTINNTGRIDVLVLNRDSFLVKTGIPKAIPQKPIVTGSEVEIASFYFDAFDSIPTMINTSAKVTNIYRVAGIDSIYYNIDTLTFAIKDSIGISKNDTAAMLNPYKFTAANGLTKDSTVFRLGGSLNQNTNINLNTRRLTIIGGNDTTRFYPNGRVSIGGTPDSSYTFYANGNSRIGNLEILRTGNAGITGYGIKAVDATSGMEFMGDGPTMFQFKPWSGDTMQTGLTNIDKGIMRIYGGFKDVNIPNLSGNVLWITPSYRFPTFQAGTKVRGIYYNPALFSAPAGVAHIAYENTTGSNLLNSASGNTRIGYTTSDTTYKLDVNGNARIGNLEILRGGLAATTGIGINVPSIDGKFEFQGSGTPASMFEFKSWPGDTVKTDLFNNDKGIMRIHGGFKNVNVPNISGNVLWITPSYRFPTLQSGVKVRGIYYNPSLFSAPAGIDHIAYENATGSNILNSAFGNTRIGYTTSDTTYKLDVNGRSRITSELTVGSQDRSSALAPFANIFSDKEIISEDGFIVQSPNALGRIKTGMDADLSTNILRLWAGSANIVSMDYVGGGTNKSNLLISDNHSTGAGASGDVNTLTVSGSLANVGLNTTVHNQINIKPNITDSFGIGLFRGIFYNPNINLLGYDISLKHTAFQNTIGNNLLNSTSGNTRIGYNTNDTTFKLDVRGNTRINGELSIDSTRSVGDSWGRVRLSNLTGVYGKSLVSGVYNVGGTIGHISFGFSDTLQSKVGLHIYQRRDTPQVVIGSGTLTGMVNNKFRVMGPQPSDDLYKIARGGYFSNNLIARVNNDTLIGLEIEPTFTNGAFSDVLNFGLRVNDGIVQLAKNSGSLIVGNTNQNSSSIVNISSTTQGLLQPRMTNTQRDAITTPATGLQLFSTTDSANYVYRGTGGGWQKIANEITKDTTIDFPSTGHGTSHDVSFTVTGAQLGDVVSIGIPHAAMSANISYTAWVSADNQVTIRLDHYASSGSVDPASGTFKVKVFK